MTAPDPRAVYPPDDPPPLDPPPMVENNVLILHKDRREEGTRYVAGKAYHWGENEAGHLTLLPGPDPRELLR